MNQPSSPLDPALLLAHTSFVRAVAAGMVRADEVDDVVQSTFLVALEKPPRNPQAVRRWLARVASSIVLRGHRDRQRREHRERTLPPPPPRPPTDQIVEQLAAHRQVVETARPLEEPYRSTILLRFFEGLDLAEIAERQRVPRATVETRSRRAMQRLRDMYTARFGRDALPMVAAIGRRTPWTPADAPRPPGEVPPTDLSSLNAATGASGATFLGGLLMTLTAKLTIAGLIATLATTTWLYWRSVEPNPADRPARATAQPSAPALLASDEGSTAASPTPSRMDVARSESSASSTAAPADLPPWLLWGHLEGLHPQFEWGTPLKVESLFDTLKPTWPEYKALASMPAQRTPLQEDGFFEVELGPAPGRVQPGRWRVTGDDPRYLPFECRVVVPPPGPPEAGPVVVETTIEVTLAAVVEGRVIDERGLPLEGAQVAILNLDPPSMQPIETQRSAADGSFRLRADQSGPMQVVAAFSFLRESWSPFEKTGSTLRPAGVLVEAQAGSLVQADDLVLRSGEAIAGRVVDRTGAAIPDALVDVRLQGRARGTWVDGAALVLANDAVLVQRASAVTDLYGEFRVNGLHAGQRYDVTVEAVGNAVAVGDAYGDVQQTILVPNERVELVIEAARLLIEVRHEGQPVEDAQVTVTSWAPEQTIQTACNLSAGDGHLVEGRAAALVPANAEIGVIVHRAGLEGADRTVQSPGSGEELTLLFDLQTHVDEETANLRLEVLDPTGRPLQRTGMLFGAKSGLLGKNLVAEKGWFLVRGLDPGAHTITVRPGGSVWAGDGLYIDETLEVEVPEEGAATQTLTVQLGGRLRLDAFDEAGTRLQPRFRLVDARGAEIEVLPTCRKEFDGRVLSISRHEDGTLFRDNVTCIDPALPAGQYTGVFELAGYRVEQVPVVIEAGKFIHIEVVLVQE